MRFTLFVGVVILQLAATFGDEFKYKCDTLKCGTGEACDTGTGLCTCADTSNEFGPLCQTSTACGAVVCVSANTELDGTTPRCYNDAGTTKCICKNGYSGDTCNIKIVDATCTANDITVNVKDIYEFRNNPTHRGQIILAADENGLDTSLCKVDIGGNDASATAAYPEANVDDCDMDLATGGSGTAADPTSVTVFAMVQLVKEFKLKDDQKFEIQCKLRSSGTSNQATITTVDDSAVTSTQKTKDTLDDLTLEIVKDDLTEITGSIAIGDPVRLLVYHPELISTKECRASNVDTFPDDQNTIKFFVDWCAKEPMDALYRSAITVTDSVTDVATEGGILGQKLTTFPLKTFMIENSASLYLQCDICFDAACASGTVDSACGNDLNAAVLTRKSAIPARRRRRSAAYPGNAGFGNTTTLQVNIIVTDGASAATGDGRGSTNNSSSDDSKCYESISVLLPIILLCVLLAAAMCMIFFFCTKLTGQHERSGETNMVYKS